MEVLRSNPRGIAQAPNDSAPQQATMVELTAELVPPPPVERPMVDVQAASGMLTRVLCWVLTLYNLLVEEGRELTAAKSVKK